MAPESTTPPASSTPWGSIIGGGVGAIAGGVGAYLAAQNARKLAREQAAAEQKLQGDITTAGTNNQTAIDAAYGAETAGFGQNMQDYLKNSKGADFSQFNLQAPQDFSFDMNAATQAEMNPQLQAIIDRSVQGKMAEGAAGGSLFSGNTGKDIAKVTEAETAKEWDAARGRAAQQQGQKYAEFTNKWNQSKDVADAGRANLQSGLNNQQAGVNTQATQFNNQQQQTNDNRQLTSQELLQSKSNQYGAQARGNSVGGGIMNVISGALGGAASGLK